MGVHRKENLILQKKFLNSLISGNTQETIYPLEKPFKRAGG